MKLKINGFLTLLLALATQITFAQDRSVSGTVSDNAGLPIPGASVLIKGTKTGTQTDANGKYTIKADENETLVFSYIGMASKQVSAKTSTVNVKLADDAVQLEGVVVTALGIKREKKSLSYSSQKLDGSAVNSTPSNNFLNNLSGKVAGLEVKTNSNFGGSTNIVLRGSKSITGNNQALIVVDGVPINNANLNTADTKDSSGGYDYGNSASDIDPSNIESVNVLKGASATALYGSEAANGAIMITTKKGRKDNGLGVSFSSTVSTGSIDKTTFPTYQKLYGGGGYDGSDNLLPYDSDGDGIEESLIVPTGYDISYGNAYDANLNVYQWNAFAPGNPNFGKATPWSYAKNDPSTLFENAMGAVNTIGVNGGDDKSNYNFSFTNNQETGVLPNSKLLKNTLSGNFNRQFGEKLKVGTTFTYTDSKGKGRNKTGYGDNFISGFRQWWQTNVDIKEQKQEYFRNNENITWNMNDPAYGDLSPAYWNNPYFDRYENYETDSRNRLLLGVNLSYDVTKNLNVLGRVTLDNSVDRQEERKAIGSHSESFGVKGLDEKSGYSLLTNNFSQQTYDLITTYNLNLSSDLNLKLLGGASFKNRVQNEFWGSTTGGLILPNIYTLSNSNSFEAPITSYVTYQKSGLYAQASFDYKKTYYIDATYRTDKTTAITKQYRSYPYFSIGGSFAFSELLKADWLNFGKLRVSYAQVGNDPEPGLGGYKIFNGSFVGNPRYGNNPSLVDFSTIKPELEKASEIGLESTLFNNRLNFEVSLYRTVTDDQIFDVPQSSSTGYAFSRINAGSLENKGVELLFSVSPIKTEEFQWQLTINWSKNKNKLLALNSGRDNLVLASFQSGLTLNATVGEPYGSIKGIDYVYDENGNKIVDADGKYLSSDTNDITIGNIQAKWNGGISNKFTYKNLSLNALIDIKHGGDVFSLDQAYGQDTGLYPETAGLNELGKPVRNSLADGGGIINPGVMENPNYVAGGSEPKYIKNTTRLDVSNSSESNGGLGYGISGNPDKHFIYDASYVKLREVGLTYSLPSKYLKDNFIKSASFSLLGNNLWIIHKNLPYADPEAGNSSGNIQGNQSGVMPSVKVYSFNIKVNF